MVVNMTKFEETIKNIKEMFPFGLCEVYEYKIAQIAIEALKKQMPKKVVVVDKNIYICPNCGANAETDCGDDMLDYRLNYCDNCGQKLDWREL